MPNIARVEALKSRSALSPVRIFKALRYSWQGLRAAWRHEAAFRQEVSLFAVMLPLTLWLRLPMRDTLLLVLLMMAVLIVEMLNSALEAIVDKVSPEQNPLAGRAKDLGSAAVLFSLAMFGLAWAVLALPALIGRLAPV